MKKLIIAVVLALVLMGSMVPLAANAAKPGTDFSGPHINLNLIGKNKIMPGTYSGNRHSIFVPIDTSNSSIPLKQPNNLSTDSLPGAGIWFTQDPTATDLYVIDGNATDDTGAQVVLPGGKYAVYIAAPAQNPKVQDPSASITGWYQYYDSTGSLYYYYQLGTVTVSKSSKWVGADSLFYTSGGEWIFDYLNDLETTYGYTQTAYFWQLLNNGDKLIQVRFYPVSN